MIAQRATEQPRLTQGQKSWAQTEGMSYSKLDHWQFLLGGPVNCTVTNSAEHLDRDHPRPHQPLADVARIVYIEVPIPNPSIYNYPAFSPKGESLNGG